MIAIPESKVFSIAPKVGLEIVVFEDGDIRIDPPSPYVMATINHDKVRVQDVLDLSSFYGSLLYVIGRSSCCPILSDINRNICLEKPEPIDESRCYILSETSELQHIIENWKSFRICSKNDFYVFPKSGSFILYVSHHDQIYLYTGWQGNSLAESVGIGVTH